MIISRKKELDFLNQSYKNTNHNWMILYGQNGVGKKTLMKEFLTDKPFFYYCAKECSKKEQLSSVNRSLSNNMGYASSIRSYFQLFEAVESKEIDIIVIDQFDKLLKTDTSIVSNMIQWFENNNSKMMVIFISSSIAFVENNLVSKIGQDALRISAFIKVKPFLFSDLCDYFQNYSLEDNLILYGILGGIPGLWSYIDKNQSIDENIYSICMDENSSLYQTAMYALNHELREHSVYNTILSALSRNKNKLNELFHDTEFSRAKISVYIKNLMELEITGKVFSFETKGHDSAQKGVYEIVNPFVRFVFTFLWNRECNFFAGTKEAYYQNNIKPKLTGFLAPTCSKVVYEYMTVQNEKGNLPLYVTTSGSFLGKVGQIDFLGYDHENKVIACFGDFSKQVITYDDYKWCLFVLEKAKVKADYLYLFGQKRFEEKLKLEARMKQNIFLIEQELLGNR